jgi:hypothetical protein
MIEQLSGPSEIIGGKKSVNISSQAPIIFEFQRKDFLLSNYSNSSGNVEFEASTTSSSDFVEGEEVYFFAFDGNNILEGVATVLDVTIGGASSVVVIDLPYLAFFPTVIFCNLNEGRNNYAFSLKLVFSSGTENIISFFPDEKGKGVIDVSGFVRGFSFVEEVVLSGAINETSNNISFYTEIGESFLSTPVSFSQIDNNDYLALYNLPKFGRETGQNLAPETCFPGVYGGTKKGLFLTDFEKPFFFEGWPFSITFLYKKTGLIDSLRKRIKQFSVNKSQVWEETKAISVNDLDLPIKIAVDPTFKSRSLSFFRVSIEGETAFSFQTNINPSTDGAFDPVITTSSGVGEWLFEDESVLTGNSISTLLNGLPDYQPQNVIIRNLLQSLITGVYFQSDKISGVFGASSLINCSVFVLNDNEIVSFSGPETSSSITEINLSNNPGLELANLGGASNLSGVLDLSGGSLTSQGLLLPSNCPGAFTVFNLSSNDLGYINLRQSFPNLGGIDNCTLDLSDNALNQSEVNTFFIDLPSIFPAGFSGRTIDIGGNNSAPNLSIPSVLNAKATLSGRGITIIHS